VRNVPERAIAPDMAVAEAWTPSRRLRAAAAAERARLERELERLRMREREVSNQLATIQATREELEHQLQVLSRFVHNSEPSKGPDTGGRRLRAVPENGPVDGDEATVLRGAAIREAAVRVLAAHGAPGTAVHYRDWFELLLARGFVPAGKDPLATFLTQIGRSPLVERSTASGMYALDLEFPERARQQLVRLNAQLNEGQDISAGSTVEEIAAARERRATLTGEIHELERRLEEALRCMAEPEEPLGARQ
jgi:hypothetical protein